MACPLFNVTLNFAPCNVLLASFESTFISCRLYEPSCLSFGTIIVINPSCKFTVLPFAFVSSVNVALFAIYSPFCSSLFTSTVNVSISLLYPIGASVSVIVIVSVPGSVIAILSILNVPFASVVYSVDCLHLVLLIVFHSLLSVFHLVLLLLLIHLVS